MKTYEEMARDVLRRIGEYENERKIHRRKAIRLTAAAMPLCAAVATGAVLWKSGALTHDPGQLMNSDPGGIITETVTAAPTGTVRETSAVRETSPVTVPVTEKAVVQTETEAAVQTAPAGESAEEPEESKASSAVQAATAEAQTAPAVQATVRETGNTATETVTEPAVVPVVTQPPAPPEGNGAMLRPGEEPAEPRTVISSYPYGTSADMRAPYAGEVCIGPSVQYAAEEYGDSVDYLVMLEIWADNGTRFVRDYSELLAEAERLASIGYISALNTDSTGENWITLHLTYDQLSSIAGRADYGYCVFFQSSGSVCTVTTPEVNNGVCQ